jgi:hypothetical protein
MKTIKIIIAYFFLLSILISYTLPSLTFAQGTTGTPGAGTTGNPTSNSYLIHIPNPLKNDQRDLPSLLTWVIREAIVPIGAIIAALMIMYAGFLYVTSRGNETKIKAAHQALLYAAIGTGILLGAEVLATAIKGTVDQIGK